MKSYGRRCIRMPPLRGDQSLVHLCLTATIKIAAARRTIRPGPGRSSYGYKTRIGRRRTEGFALAARAAKCSLSLAFAPPPLATFVPDRPGLAPLDTRPIAGPVIRSVQVAVYCGGRCRSRTASLATLASFVQIPSVDPKNCAHRSPNRKMTIDSTVLKDVTTPSQPATHLPRCRDADAASAHRVAERCLDGRTIQPPFATVS
jgi:hypothetical protein